MSMNRSSQLSSRSSSVILSYICWIALPFSIAHTLTADRKDSSLPFSLRILSLALFSVFDWRVILIENDLSRIVSVTLEIPANTLGP